MGFLGNIISGAISDGIKKGLGNAIGKAVEDIVKPSVENYAQKQADQINAAGEQVAKSTEELRKANDELGQTAAASADTQPATGGGLADLEAVLGGWAKHAESYATEMAKNMKICPKCGQACSAEKEFCPQCGAKLPEHTAAHDYTCQKCGTLNTPGSKHCSKCGALLPGAEAEAKRKEENDAAVAAEMRTKLTAFPTMDTLGTDLKLEDTSAEQGYPFITLSMEGSSTIVQQYIQKLLSNGFSIKTGVDCSYQKVENGVCHVFSNEIDMEEGSIRCYFWDDMEYKPETPKQPEPDLADLAKGLFKKFF